MRAKGNKTQARQCSASCDFKVMHLAVLTFSLLLVVPAVLGLRQSVWAQAPGPELFANEPRTPLELWDAVDYLLRTGQAKKALPYLDRFLKSRPDDSTLIAIRNRYGPGSILRLSDDPATRQFAKPLTEAMVAAARKYATQPERITRLITELTGTPQEQDYAVRHLREAGPDAIPFLVEALPRPELSAKDRRIMVYNIGRLDYSAVPPLIAVLDSDDPALAADAARSLGRIGDTQSIPQLTFLAASTTASPIVRTAAQDAITELTGRPFTAQLHTPVRVLTATAWRYHRHQVEFTTDPIVVWEWNKQRKVPSARRIFRTQAEAMFGLRLAHEALQLNPNDRDAQIALLSLALEKAVERSGFSSFLSQEQATAAAAITSGPSLLDDVLKTALADGKTDLAATVARLLARVTEPTALSTTDGLHPLVTALYAPGRRVQFAAVKTLVTLAPPRPFPGSSRVVPTLSRFVINQELPRAVVIDGNPNRGSQLAGFLINLGYDPELELTGNRGFLAAAESANIELILISYDLFQEGWGLNDTLANLRADARTAAIPVSIYGPRDVQFKRPSLEQDYPGIRFLVQPVNAETLQLQLRGLLTPLSEAERASYAREATALLAQISKGGKGPLSANLTTAVPALTTALGWAETAPSAAAALGDVPDPDAQRSLASLTLDPSRDPTLRRQCATQLLRSIQQFGRLITAAQEAQLIGSIHAETDTTVQAKLMTILNTSVLHQRLARLDQPHCLESQCPFTHP